MPKDSDQALPGSPFLLPERAAHVGENQKFMRAPLLAEGRSVDSLFSSPPGKVTVKYSQRLTDETLFQLDLSRAPTKDIIR